ncbi:MAG: FapA family protein [Spirochaetaceae bacterium]|jgi:uncharacterized protein (DUF342 family)|nr:FapA family protein [Spirochaetaceae bacterium]
MDRQRQLEVLDINDERFHLTVSEDAMTVWAEFMPSRGSGPPIGLKQIDAMLAFEYIVHGIQEQVIRGAVAECAWAVAPFRLVVARGTEPVAEVPPYVEMLSEFNPNKKNGIQESEKGQVDFREFSPFTIVRKDKYLAVQHPGNPGKDGCNVYGENLPFEIAPRKNIQAGKNIRIEKNGYYAAKDGQLLLTGEVLNVEETLVIKGSVGYATGHIDFPGDIIIHGFVNDGFKLYSGGTITCMQTLDVTDVNAKHGLNVNGGIIGRLESTIKIGDDVNVRFINHCNFFSEGDITVRSEIIHSTIHTKGRVTVEEGSDIINSTIYSFHSVSAANITNPTGKVNAFYLGTDFNLRDAVNESRLRLNAITRKYDRLKTLLDAPLENRYKDIEKAYKLIEAQWLKEKENLDELLKRFYVDPGAELMVADEIAWGTRIEICEAVLALPRSMHETTFKLSENGKSVVTEAGVPKESGKRLKLLSGRRRVKNDGEPAKGRAG